MKSKDLALLVDGNNYLWRAYHAFPETFTSDGIPNNAVNGFFRILTADIGKLRPDYIAVAFDAGRSWRWDVYPEYKANRAICVDPIARGYVRAQGRVIRMALRALGVKVHRKVGVEADDILGTLSMRFHEERVPSLISSTDKDFNQLLNKNISILKANTREILTSRYTRDRYGVHPKQMVDYLSLLGDGSDNIPGAFRIGPKTAARLLTEYGTLAEVMRAKKKQSASIQKSLSSFDWKLNRKLITIDTDLPLIFNLETYERPRMKGNDDAEKIFDAIELNGTYRAIKGLL